jgi:hypothetical protein
MNWNRLPHELKLQVWGNVVASHTNNDSRRTGLAAYACVSREWKFFFEQYTFRHLIIRPKDFTEFRMIVDSSRRDFVKHIVLQLKITDQHSAAHPSSRRSRSISVKEQQRRNDRMFSLSIQKLLGLLSMWTTSAAYTGAGLTLELGAYSVYENDITRRSARFYGKYLEGSPLDTDAYPFASHLKSCEFPGIPLWNPRRRLPQGRTLRPLPGPVQELLGQAPLSLTEGCELPRPAVVTGFQVRLQYIPNFHPRALGRIIESLPNIADIRLEHWIYTNEQVPSDGSIGEEAPHVLPGLPWSPHPPPSFRSLSLYEEETHWRHGDNTAWTTSFFPISLSTHRLLGSLFAHRLLDWSVNLEHLSVSGVIQAEAFLRESERIRHSCVWPNLKSLALTSCSCVGHDNGVVQHMVMFAVKAAAKMPLLDTMEIWSEGYRAGGIFRYHWADYRDGGVPAIEWIGTWDVEFTKQLVDKWQGVVDARNLREFNDCMERTGVKGGREWSKAEFGRIYGCKIQVKHEIIPATAAKSIRGPGIMLERLKLKKLVLHDLSRELVKAYC